MPEPARRLVPVAKAAAAMSVSTRTIRRYIARGDLPAYRVGSTRTIRVSLDDVDKLLHRLPTAGDAA